MPQDSLTGWDRKRLRRWLALFFLALVIPTVILIHQAYSELKWGTFHQYQLQAEELAARINEHFMQLVTKEEARPFTDYAFLNIAGDPSASFLQRSPLSAYPVTSAIPGLIGYFQVDAQGAFSTPLLPQLALAPTVYGISMQELRQREWLIERIQQILSQNRLVRRGEADVAGAKGSVTESRQRQEPRRDRTAEPNSLGAVADKDASDRAPLDDAATVLKQEPAEAQVQAQAAFDQLNEAPVRREQKKQFLANKLGRVEDLKLDYRYQDEATFGKLTQAVSKAVPVLPLDVAFVVKRRFNGPYGLALSSGTKDADSIVDRGGRHLFVVPWRDYTLVGVWHHLSSNYRWLSCCPCVWKN